MPDLREAILKEHLRAQRLGVLIRASISPATLRTLNHLKNATRRTYRDILSIILNVYRHHPELFQINPPGRTTRTIHFRLSKKDSTTVYTWAWKRKQKRCYFIGDLAAQFFSMIPIKAFIGVLKRREDQALRLIEDIKCYERARTACG